MKKHCYSTTIECFFELFDDQSPNDLLTSINTFANYRTILNRPTNNIYFILHGSW